MQGSGTVVGSGWSSTYGQTVTLTATISAQNGVAPTGNVTFFSHIQPSAGTNPAQVRSDILGTAPLSTNGRVTRATLRLKNLQPGQYQIQAFYPGSTTDLPSNSSYNPYTNQTVVQSSTMTTLTTSATSPALGSSVTLMAHVDPTMYGADAPSGSVCFMAGNVVLGTAPVTTANGKTTASIKAPWLAVGSASIVASYGGDYNYANSSSADRTVNVTPDSAPTSVTVKGPKTVKPGAKYMATANSNGSGAMLFSLAAFGNGPGNLAIDSAAGIVSFKVPKHSLKRFSYEVVASNAAGRAVSSPVAVTVK